MVIVLWVKFIGIDVLLFAEDQRININRTNYEIYHNNNKDM